MVQEKRLAESWPIECARPTKQTCTTRPLVVPQPTTRPSAVSQRNKRALDSDSGQVPAALHQADKVGVRQGMRCMLSRLGVTAGFTGFQSRHCAYD